MLLRQLIQQSACSPCLLFRDPFIETNPEQLVQEVIGLANVDADGAKYIIFGVNKGTMEGSGIVGIDEDAVIDLKKAHRLISAMVQPVLHLAFIFDRIDGKLVGALEIDGCDAAPYVLRQNHSKTLTHGQAWIRDGKQLRLAEPNDLEQIRTRREQKQNWAVEVGFDDQAKCDLLELEVPDTSNSPSVQARQGIKQSLDWKQSAKDMMGTVNTRILRMLHVRQHGNEVEFDQRGVDTLTLLHENSENAPAEEDDYFYYEEKAVKLNLVVCNRNQDGLDALSIELAFPRTPDFEVAEHLYRNPDDKCASLAIEMLEYPEVRRVKGGAIVRTSLKHLAPNRPEQVFNCALRLAVGPGMRGKSVAIQYALRAKNRPTPGRGRLKIKFC